MEKRLLTTIAVLIIVSLGLLFVYERQTQEAAQEFKERYAQVERLRANVITIEQNKNRDLKDIQRLNLLLNKQMHDALILENSKSYLAKIFFVSMLVLILLVWLVVARSTRRLQQSLEESNRALNEKLHQIDELNHTLDQKVQQRTEVLSSALEKLHKVHRDLQNTQAQLLQSEKFAALGQLAAGVAHEINNPIGFINTNLQILEQYVLHYTQLLGILNKLEKALKDKDHDKVALIVTSWEKIRKETNFAFIGGDIGNLIKESREGIEKIRKIVLDLKTLASPDKGVMAPVSMEGIVESILNVVWNEIKYKAQVSKDYQSVPPVVCNPQKIGQVLVNLLMNAAQSIKEKGIIGIKIYNRDDYTCVDVSDTGCGIEPQNLTKIFDPFFTTKPVGTGVGLGLSISYDIVRKHGGKMAFQSQQGKGSVFTLMLPSVAAYSYDSAQL